MLHRFQMIPANKLQKLYRVSRSLETRAESLKSVRRKRLTSLGDSRIEEEYKVTHCQSLGRLRSYPKCVFNSNSFLNFKMGKPILGYWDLRGRCEPIRYLLHYKKVDFEDKRYPMDAEGFQEWQKDKFSLGCDFPNLPYYIDGDIKLTQSIAIMRYLGNKLGLDGKTDEQKRRILMAEQQSVDFRDKMRSYVVGSDYEKISKEEFLKSVQPMFQLWQKFLGDRQFLAGDDVTYVDFLVFENLDYYRLFHETILDDYPSVKAYFSRMKSLPELQEYSKSPVRRPWPLFGPMAKFGGGGEPPKHL